MRFLAIERPVEGAADARFTPEISADEARRVWELQQAGVIREIYFRDDMPAAVLMLECADETETRAVLATLPLVAAGLIDFEVMPLRAYPGFGRLFASSGWA
jgi:muconolactone delta-isomerase